MEILSAQNIYKSYTVDKLKINILDGISLNINKGDFITIVGRSGAGKSTLLYSISGLEKIDNVEVNFNNKNIQKMSDKEISKLRKKDFGFIFQFYNLLPNLTVSENILFPLELSRVKKAEKEKILKEIIKDVSLEGKEKKYPYQLSGGEQQRVAVARALAINPSIIFADEPTGNLDVSTGDEILNLMLKLNKEKNVTFVVVTHDSKIASLGTREIRIEDGRII